MKKTISLVLGMAFLIPVLSSDTAFARHVKSHHYRRPVVHRHVHRPVVVHRHVPSRVIYRPVVTHVRPHYHYGYFDPCYDHLHSTGVFWDVNLANPGWSLSFGSHW